MTHTKIEDFVRTLRLRLPRNSREAERLAEEARDHLCEATERLIADGNSEEESVQQALARFGGLDVLVHAFACGVQNGRAQAAATACLVGVAAVTATLNLFLLIHTLLPPEIHEASAPLLAFKLLSFAFVVAAGGLSVTTWSRLAPQPATARWIGSLLLVGAVAAVWTVLHLARATGDFEYWVLPLALLQAVQGCLTLLVFGDLLRLPAGAPLDVR